MRTGDLGKWCAALSALAAGCGGPEAQGPAAPGIQGIVASHRAADGGLLVDGRTYLGGARGADSDASGFVYYDPVAPGRAPVSYELDGHALGYAAPEVSPHATSAATFVPHPLDAVLTLDPADALHLEGDGFHLDVPAGALLVGGEPLAEPYSAGVARVRAGDRYGLPGDLVALRNDVDLTPFVADEIVVARAWVGDLAVTLAEDADATVVVELAADSPLLAPDTPVGVYQYSGSSARWLYGGAAEIDAGARTATFARGSLGWFALGREPADRGCVRGVVVDERGAPLTGAEVTLVEPGTIGVDRTTTVEGAFCLPIGADTSGAELRVVGFSPDHARLYRWTGEAAGGGVGRCGDPACASIGTIRPESWADADEDRSWGGPGGDCDDADPAVNPHPVYGDGSWCGSAL